MELFDRRLPVFVYGTLRPGQPNWRRLAPRAIAVRRAVLPDHALYATHRSFPYAAPHAGGAVVGDLITIDPDHFPAALADLDRLEGFRPLRATNHYDRQAVEVLIDDTTEAAWAYIAGATTRRELTDNDIIPAGDWLHPGHIRCA